LDVGEGLLGVDGGGSSADLGPLSGESCTNARQLPFVANRAVLNDTTLGRRNDVSARCGGRGGDTVYGLKVVEPYVFVDAAPVGSWRPRVYLKPSCESPDLVHDVCATSSFWSSRFPLGQYYLIIDSDDVGGDYQLTVEQRPTAIGTGASCSSPKFLSFTGDTATVTTYTRGVSDGPKLRCTGTSGRDVYTFLLGAPQKVEATVTALTPGFYPALALRRGGSACPSGPDLSCSTGLGSSVTITPPSSLDIGSYALVVTGGSGTVGQYTLTVKVSP
jgi:hypothetical protein